MVVLLAQPTDRSSSATSCITVRGLSAHRQFSTFHSLALNFNSSTIHSSLVYIVALS